MPTSPWTEQDRERLGERVSEARRQLGRGRYALAKSVGMTEVTWTRIERGLPARAMSYAGVERALGWDEGTCEGVLAGAEQAQPIDAVVRALRNSPHLDAASRTALEQLYLSLVEQARQLHNYRSDRRRRPRTDQ